MRKPSVYRPGSVISEIVENIRKAQARATPITFDFRLTCTFDELTALVTHVDKFIKENRSPNTNEERALIDAMIALAAALPSRGKP